MINVIFDRDFYESLYLDIKFLGLERTLQRMAMLGHHPAFVKVAVKRAMKEKGI